jgi:molybdopterin-containing oxidoreductase family iron-sulfur binding subunit
VAKLQAEARNYSLLGELNTRPRTTYLAAVRNPNPEIEA